MFQRLRDAIDSRIAEEQARQKSAQESLARSNSARRPSRNLSPSRRANRPRRNTGTPVRGPDPTEFEAAFTIGDDESSSRSATPKPESVAGSDATIAVTPADENATEAKTENSSSADRESSANTAAPATSSTETTQLSSELPAEVRVKLRKLAKMEARYQDLLKAYRMAHSRVLSIEPFEAALRENTPLTSISDPKALTEYLNQISLKGDMVVEELKRVTTERDDYKKKLEEAQQSTKAAWDEVAGLKKGKKQNADGKDSEGKSAELAIDTSVTNDKPSDSQDAATPTTTASRLAQVFSPKREPAKPAESQEGSEEFFSFDNEVPRLEAELKEKQEEVETLKAQAESLRRDLSVARESTEGMVHSLENATRELVELRDLKEKQDVEIQSLKTSKQEDIDELKAKLETSEKTIKETSEEIAKLKAELKSKTDEIESLQDQAKTSANDEEQSDVKAKLDQVTEEKDASEKRLGVLQGLVDSLRSQLKDTEKTVSDLKGDVEKKTEDAGKLQNIVDFFDDNLKDSTEWQQAKDQITSGKQASFDNLRKSLAPQQKAEEVKEAAQPNNQPAPPAGGAGPNKKKKNKKKKGGKGGEETAKAAVAEEPETPASQPDQQASNSVELEKQIASLTQQVEEKDAAIDRLSSRLKGEEDLKEEIESLRDDLLHLGQDHVEAKDKIKELTAEKTALEETITKLEKELTDLRTNASKGADSEKAHNDLKGEYESLKVRFTTLETELSAAQQLAATRFKDLTDLRETMQKLQPELKQLRAESTELKSTKETLNSKTSELRTLEGKHEELRTEMKAAKSKIVEREKEVKTLNQKIRQETDNRLKAEERLTLAQSDLRFSESKKQEALETKERISNDLTKAHDDLKNARSKIRELENQITQLNKDLEGLREEIQLKTAQHASAQSLMNSMRDQGSEIGMQMKEARERCESLEEELADAHRLLSERTREGETMRRLLSDIESRAEAKVRDFKERMEAAIEERDRAEDEASAQGRRRARELEELKSKVREAEKALRSAEEDKEELEHSQRDWKRRRDQLEEQAERSTQELNDIREAMTRLRDALDESEKQVRDLEKEKAELRRSVEETSARLEKLRKSNRALTDEARFGQTPQSSRSSIDSGSRRAIASPVSKDRSPSARRSETPSGGAIDYIYLKNVLLQFLGEPHRLSMVNAEAAQFLTTRDLAHQDDVSGVQAATSADSALAQFYNHSFAIHETSDISAPGTHSAADSVRESGLWTDSGGGSSAETIEDSEVSEQEVGIHGPITDLQDIPSAAYLDSIVPQTMTVNLIVGVVTIRPPRRIVTKQWKKELDLVEVVVGDETRSGFGVTFWLPPEARTVTGKDDIETKAGHELRHTLETLRPRDIVLLRMVGLSTFRERVYGQSLRKGITTVELLHRQRVDATGVGGRYSAKRLRLCQGLSPTRSDPNPDHSHPDDAADAAAAGAKKDDLPVVKTSKVREWIRRFVDAAPEGAGGGMQSPPAKRGPIWLPPDSQDGLL